MGASPGAAPATGLPLGLDSVPRKLREKKQSGTPGPRGADGVDPEAWMDVAGPLRGCPVPAHHPGGGTAPELGGGRGEQLSLSRVLSRSPGQGVGAPTRGRCPRLRRKGAPGPPGAVSAGRRLRPGPRGSPPTWPASWGRASLLGRPYPLAPCCLRETLMALALHFRAGRPHALGAPFLSAPSPALPSARAGLLQNLFVLHGACSLSTTVHRDKEA